MTGNLTFIPTPAEVKLLLRLRQLANQNAPLVLFDLEHGCLHTIGKPETLGQPFLNQSTIAPHQSLTESTNTNIVRT